ncbi:MAG TPA: hypothetical protein VNT03_01880 [Baekduia sp.]|nr:hypothetical protein [Baekduia sp.]
MSAPSSTHIDLEREQALDDPPRPEPAAGRRPPYLRLLALLVVPFAVAAIVYGVSSGLSPKYESSVTLLVGVPGTGQLSDQSVSAANDLASQYAQLGDSGPVLRSTERRLGMPTGSLEGDVTASTVAAQNLIRISATAGDRGSAIKRANAASGAFTSYIGRLNRRQGDQYNDAVNERLKPLDEEIAKARRELEQDDQADPTRSDDALVYSNLVSQRQQVAASLAQDVVASQARVQPISDALGASKVSPKPELYAVIAFGALALICIRLAWVLLRPSRR